MKCNTKVATSGLIFQKVFIGSFFCMLIITFLIQFICRQERVHVCVSYCMVCASVEEDNPWIIAHTETQTIQ